MTGKEDLLKTKYKAGEREEIERASSDISSNDAVLVPYPSCVRIFIIKIFVEILHKFGNRSLKLNICMYLKKTLKQLFMFLTLHKLFKCVSNEFFFCITLS